MSRRPIIAGVRTGDEESEDEPRRRFREAMARFPTGVSVVAVRDEDEVAALTVSAFASVSLDPPLVLVCLGLDAAVLPFLEESGEFTVNFLAADARDAASRFSQRMPEDPSWFAPGTAVLRDALASVVCTLEAVHPGGDHRIVVGRVERVELGTERPPLVYHARGYRKLA